MKSSHPLKIQRTNSHAPDQVFTLALMFPINLRSEQKLYTVPKSASNLSVNLELDRQLQTELAKVIEATMAPSRSQEPIAQTKDCSSSLANEASALQIKKRKLSQGPKTNPISDDTKRRRISIEPEVIVLSNKLDIGLDVPDEKTFLNKDTEDDATHTTTTNKAENADEQTSTGMTEQKILPETEKDLNMGESATKLSAFSTNGKSVLHRVERKNVEIGNELHKRIHKRFGSEDIQSNLPHTDSRDIVAVQGIDSQEDVQANNDSHESEDDAPETVTAATGLAQARLAISEATKIAERYGILVYWETVLNML